MHKICAKAGGEGGLYTDDMRGGEYLGEDLDGGASRALFAIALQLSSSLLYCTKGPITDADVVALAELVAGASCSCAPSPHSPLSTGEVVAGAA